jgi:hypothetical protein
MLKLYQDLIKNFHIVFIDQSKRFKDKDSIKYTTITEKFGIKMIFSYFKSTFYNRIRSQIGSNVTK